MQWARGGVVEEKARRKTLHPKNLASGEVLPTPSVSVVEREQWAVKSWRWRQDSDVVWRPLEPHLSHTVPF